ncbi:MAG: hypothetical protein GKR91_02825 [Pseudomonadales bacterium]|nr:hypothetical protein [Pseudomonadales bacterium]
MDKIKIKSGIYKRLPILLFVSALSSNNVSANSFYQFSVSAGNEDNVPRGLDSIHELDSHFVRFDLSAGKLYQLGLNDTVTLSSNVFARRLNDLGGFDSQGLGISANFSHKLGFGAYAGRFGAILSATREEFRGEARDNDLYGIEINYQKRLGPAWFVYGGIDYQESRADSLPDDPAISAFGYDPTARLPYELFEYDSSSVFLELEYTFENGILASGGYRHIDGATVASTTQPGQDLYKISDAFYSDPAFPNPWFGYQLEADTDEWSLGVSLPIGRDSSFDVGYSWHDIRATGNRDYENSIVSVTFTQGF